MIRSGDRIGPYTLVSRLGRGAFGVVWLAERRSLLLTTSVALKLPNDEEIDLDAVRREATVWAHAAGHPNVLPIIDADVYNGQVVIVSEYAPDGSLSVWLKQHGGKAPSVDAAVRMIDGVLAGLGHLHAKNIIHRDLKPDNILLQGETPRLADFGIARVLKMTGPYTTMVSGTPHYMAPEAYRGKRSEQTDLWAVGVIFYQLLTGSYPFSHDDLPSIMYAVFNDEPASLPPTLPSQLRGIVAKALAKDPARRYHTIREMREAIQQFLHSQSMLKSRAVSEVEIPTIRNLSESLAPTLQDDAALPSAVGPELADEETFLQRVGGRAIEFTGDDAAYLQWLRANPTGYVINTAKAMNPKYMVLHRATCSYISKLEPELAGGFTERGYVKICARAIEPLRTWVKRHGRIDGSFSRECSLCNPAQNKQHEIGIGASPAHAADKRRRWDESTFFAEAGKHLSSSELASLRQLYDYSIRSARVTWGAGSKYGSFNAKFDHISNKSLYTVNADGTLYLNFAWLKDNRAGEEAAKQFGLKLMRLRSFNIPRDYMERYVGVPVMRWADQVSEFIAAISGVTRPDLTAPGDITSDEQTTIAHSAARAVELTGDLSGAQTRRTHIDKGYLDAKDDVAFRTSAEAASCFGKIYRGLQQGGIKHPKEASKIIWFPKLYKNGEWNNRMSADEDTIWEINESPEKAKEHIDRVLKEGIYNRIIFVRVKSPVDNKAYRFKGEYQLDRQATNYQDGLVWRRISERVQTYQPA